MDLIDDHHDSFIKRWNEPQSENQDDVKERKRKEIVQLLLEFGQVVALETKYGNLFRGTTADDICEKLSHKLMQ